MTRFGVTAPKTQHVFFVDGSGYHTHEGNKASYAVIKYDTSKNTYHTVSEVVVPQPCSVQLAEIKALSVACKLGAGKACTIYTDSAYGHLGQYGHSLVFREQMVRPLLLLTAIQLIKKLAIVKCRIHTTDETTITKGNAAADEARVRRDVY